jgi:excisionase family DNA binding protein
MKVASNKNSWEDWAGRVRLWTPLALSRLLSIPVATLYKWRQQGVGPPAVRLGKHIRYRPEAVEQWLKSQEDHPYGIR